MKKTLLTVLALGCASSLMIAGSAMATVVTTTYMDNTINFLDSNLTTDYARDLGDTNGTPKIEKMTITYDDVTGALSYVNIFMTGRRTDDTLMINTGGGGEWDAWDSYVVDRSMTNSVADYTGALEDGFYSTKNATDPDNITYASELYADGFEERVGHVSGLEGGGVISTAFDPTWTITTDNTYTSTDIGFLTYDFTGFEINLDLADFVLAYTPYCANDVIVAGPGNPVPEPATMLLFGTGIAGLFGASKRRKKQA